MITSLHLFSPHWFLCFWCLIQFLWWVWHKASWFAVTIFLHFLAIAWHFKCCWAASLYSLSFSASKFSKHFRHFNPYYLGKTRCLDLRVSWRGRTWVPYHRFFHKGPRSLCTLRLIQFSLAVLLLSPLSGLELKLATFPHILKFTSVLSCPSLCQKFSDTSLSFTDTLWLLLWEFNNFSCPNWLLDYFSLRIWCLWQRNMPLEHSEFRQNVMVVKSK